MQDPPVDSVETLGKMFNLHKCNLVDARNMVFDIDTFKAP